MPAVPAGFKVEVFADNLKAPRQIRRAPNGDLFVMEQAAGQITILRGNKDGKPETTSVYATGLTTNFGINFYPNGANPQWVYVGNTGSVVRFPYKNGDLKASGPAETLISDLPPRGNHVDARHRVLERRHEDVRGGGFGRQRVRHAAGSGASRQHSPVHAGRQVREDLRFRNSQSGGPGHQSRPPASCGARSTSATTSATTWFRTTSPASRKTASTAGRGSTSASTRTTAPRWSGRPTRPSIRSSSRTC